MSMKRVPRMMVWFISFVTTKNVLREMLLLKIEVKVLPAICSLELCQIVSSLKSFEKTKDILIKYCFEDIWVRTCKKSSKICSMIVSARCNTWDSRVWSSVSDLVVDWFLILDRRYFRIAESFCWACLRVCNSDLRVLISDCNSRIVVVILDFFLLRILVRS